MLMMQPPSPCCCMMRLAACAHQSGAVRFSRMMRSMWRGAAPASSPGGPPPALLTSTSRRPRRCTTSANSRATASASRTSQAMNCARRAPSDGSSVSAGALRPHTTTCAPAARKARAMPAPIPREPPVTSTTAPGRRISAVGCSMFASYGLVWYFQAMQRDPPLTLPQVLARAARLFGDAPAIVEEHQRLTFAALAARVGQASAAFLGAGLSAGERVAIWAPNCAEWVIAALGALAVGGIVVPLNTRLKGKEAAFILRRSGCRALLVIDEFLGTNYPQLLSGHTLPDLERIIVLAAAGTGVTDDARLERWQDFLARGNGVPPAAVNARSARVGPADIADIMFTSGTTGEPKGVLSTHEQNVRVFRTWSEVVGLRQGDRYLIVNPFFHSFGYKAGWLACLLQGATMYPLAVFDAGRALAMIEAER